MLSKILDAIPSDLAGSKAVGAVRVFARTMCQFIRMCVRVLRFIKRVFRFGPRTGEDGSKGWSSDGIAGYAAGSRPIVERNTTILAKFLYTASTLGDGFAALAAYCVTQIPGWERHIDIRTWSAIVSRYSSKPSVNYRHLFERTFTSIQLLWTPKDHTHFHSARFRSSANASLKKLVADNGFTPYEVSMATSDHLNSDGCRYYYCAKDLKIKFRDDALCDRHVLIMTDVDYYTNMNAYLALGKPILMYTLYPTTPAHTGIDYSFYTKDNLIYYNVRGGAVYKNPVWDFNGDTIAVVDDQDALITFDVVQKVVFNDPQHRIIMLLPAVKVPFPFWLHLETPRLMKHRQITSGEVNAIYAPISKTISLSMNGQKDAVTINMATYESIKTRMETKVANKFLVADVERILQNMEDESNTATATTVYNVLNANEPLCADEITETNVIATHYQTIKPLVTEDGKEYGFAVTSSLVENPAVFPCKSVNNDHATIAGRIEKVRNTTWPAKNYESLAMEFLEKLIPERLRHTGIPLSYAEVDDIQARPSQRARTQQAVLQIGVHALNRIQAFIKSEAYANFNDPRNISTCAAATTVSMSTFTYAFKRSVMSHQKWYAPGLDPVEIGEQMQTICGEGTIVTDYSRFDGSISEFLQIAIVEKAYVMWVKDEHKVEFRTHFAQIFKQVAYTTNGIRYDPGFSTRSGSPLTTDGNTLINAFISYCALRKIYNRDMSWNYLGLYLGDDGVNRNIPHLEQAIVDVSRELGLSVDIGTIQRGKPVPFLGRIFCDPIRSLDSFQDPRRTLPKLHLATNKTVSLEQAAYNKALGYLTTDELTPVIGVWAKKTIALSGIAVPHRLLTEELYKINNSWSQVDRDLIFTTFCDIMKWDSDTVHNCESLINHATTVWNYPVIWSNIRATKIECVHQGELLYPPSTRRLTAKEFIFNKTENSPKQTKTDQKEILPTDKEDSKQWPPKNQSSPPLQTSNNSKLHTKNGKIKPKKESGNSSGTSAKKPSALNGKGSRRQRQPKSP